MYRFNHEEMQVLPRGMGLVKRGKNCPKREVYQRKDKDFVEI